MSLVITPSSQKQRELPQNGYYNAVCVDAINLGIRPSYNGEKKHMCRLVFELDQQNSQGEHFILSRTYTASLHERSALRQDLEGWRNKPFSEEELSDGFDLEKVVGQPCELKVIHKQSGETSYAQIASIHPGKAPMNPSGEYTRVQDR